MVTRETWMMELPDKMSASIGLQARQFKSNKASAAAAGDRSCWTDTPADKERKEKVHSYIVFHIYLNVLGYIFGVHYFGPLYLHEYTFILIHLIISLFRY